MRCPDCNKFVSFDDPEVEVDSEDINGNDATANAVIRRNCGECGTELQTAEIEITTGELECPKCQGRPTDEDGNPIPKEQWKDPEADDDDDYIELNSTDVEATDRLQDKDKHGKPIKNYRSMKHLIGAEVTFNLKCKRCGHEWSETSSDELSASEFESSV